MEDSLEKQPLFGDPATYSSQATGDAERGPPRYNDGAVPLYYDRTESPRQRMVLWLCVAFVLVMALISLGVSINRAVVEGHPSYALLGLSILALLIIESLLILFWRKGDLAKEKIWFIYFLGFCILLETILNDVVCGSHPK